jgi:hypothetical protein
MESCHLLLRQPNIQLRRANIPRRANVTAIPKRANLAM